MRMAVMVLCFSAGQKARKVPENGYLSRVGCGTVDQYMTLASDLRVLGNLECVVNFQA